MKIKLNIGRKGQGGIDPIAALGMVGFIVICGIAGWYYLQPTPPSLLVLETDATVEEEGSRCSAIVTGKVFNNGGITATGITVQCTAGYGSTQPVTIPLNDIEGRKIRDFFAKVPLTSCSVGISEQCSVTCENCKK